MLILVQVLLFWLDGGLQFDVLLPVIIYNALVIPYLVALIHLLDNQAVTALNSMRPTLAIVEPEFDEHQYRLSTMPSRATFIAGLTLVVSLVLSEQLGSVPVRYAALDDLPIFTIIYHIIDKSAAFLSGAFVYHTIRQLHLVSAIYSNHTRINLFDIKPLYAFSKLTASTAVGLVACVYGWMLINPELMADPSGLIGVVLFTILAVAVFVWPLVGAHRLMETEKERMLHDINLQFGAIFAMFNQRLREDDYPAVEMLNGAIASLEIQHARVKAIPTWPWRPETARFVLAAIPLPLVLKVVVTPWDWTTTIVQVESVQERGKHNVKASNVYTGIQGPNCPGGTNRHQGQS